MKKVIGYLGHVILALLTTIIIVVACFWAMLPGGILLVLGIFASIGEWAATVGGILMLAGLIFPFVLNKPWQKVMNKITDIITIPDQKLCAWAGIFNKESTK